MATMAPLEMIYIIPASILVAKQNIHKNLEIVNQKHTDIAEIFKGENRNSIEKVALYGIVPVVEMAYISTDWEERGVPTVADVAEDPIAMGGEDSSIAKVVAAFLIAMAEEAHQAAMETAVCFIAKAKKVSILTEAEEGDTIAGLVSAFSVISIIPSNSKKQTGEVSSIYSAVA